jgi:outer membrane immunogenic protein
MKCVVSGRSSRVVQAALLSVSASALVAGTPALAQPMTWTGFYVGGYVGAAHGRSKASTASDCTLPPFVGYYCDSTGVGAGNAAAVNAAGTGTMTDTGFTGGLLAGYNWQRDRIVYGLESDFGTFRLRGSRQQSGAYPDNVWQNPGDPFTVGSSFSTNWLFTLRGRTGYLFAPNLMMFGTGGIAVTRLRVSNTFTDADSLAGGISPAVFNGTPGISTKTGFVLGGGLEWKINGHWSIRGEYLYVDFGHVSTTGVISNPGIGPGYAQGLTTTADLSAHIARVGITYGF